MTETILERVQADTRTAMKAGERDRVGALRMVADALQKDAKQGGDDEVAVLRRERKRRLEAAAPTARVAARTAPRRRRPRRAVIEGYLPAELSDEELERLVDEAIAASGASDQAAIGKVMGAVMPKVAGRADGRRVSAAVREKLAA